MADWLEVEADVNDRRAGVQELAGVGADAIRFLVAGVGGWLRNVDDEQMQASWSMFATSRSGRRRSGTI
jgi:hypothetical protein